MKDIFDFIFDNIINTWFGGFFLTIYGIKRCKKTMKNMNWNSNWLSYNAFVQGLAASIGCIALGFVILYFKIV